MIALPDDVTKYVNKVISYESSPTRYMISRERKFTLVADAASPGSDSLGLLSDSDLNENPYVSLDFLIIDNDGKPPIPSWANATPDDVAKYAKQSDWVSYVGHGNIERWGNFDKDLVAQTATSKALPVVLQPLVRPVSSPWIHPGMMNTQMSPERGIAS